MENMWRSEDNFGSMFSPSTTGTLWRSNSGSLGLADPLPVEPSPRPVVDTCEANLGKSLKGQAAALFRTEHILARAASLEPCL